MANTTIRGISIGQLAAHWGCSRANVSKNVAKGMPMESFDAADAWRLAQAVRGVGYRSRKNQNAGLGLSESADLSAATRDSGRGAGGQTASDEFSPENDAPPEPPPPPFSTRKKPRLLKTLAASLAASIEVETEALRLVQTASATLLPLRIAAYNKAKEGRIQSQRLVRAWDLETRTIIPFSEAVEMATRFMVPMLTRLRSIAKRAGGLANPADPIHASTVIEREIEAAIAEAQALYEKAISAK